MIIDLRSDTVTKPSKEMLVKMMTADLGDDVFREDPTVTSLEKEVAKLFNKEAAIFCPSGTMTNQIAINAHTQPGDEVICDATAHIYHYETGGMAKNAGVQSKLIHSAFGKISAKDIENNIHEDYDWLPKTSLVSIENTCNKAGGIFYSKEEISAIYTSCKTNKLPLHIDGARIFNAMLVGNYNASFVGDNCDSISICLSKGLGAPVGSLLVGDAIFIKKAQRLRKVFGGAMRQAGLLAAAGLYALDNNINRLTDDHSKCKKIAECLQRCNYVKNILPVHTNIVIFTIEPKTNKNFEVYLQNNNIKLSIFGKNTYRIVTHMDISDDMITILEKTLIQY